MHRLPAPTALLEQDCVVLPREAARHVKTLRLKRDEEIELFDGAGSSRVFRNSESGFVAAGRLRRVPRPNRSITLFACVTKGSRWDWTIEKAVELGVSRIVPVISDRVIVRLSADERIAKAERWRRVAEDAARQSDAAWIPEVVPAVDFGDALALVKECDEVFVGALTAPPPQPLLQAALESRRRLGSAGRSYGLFTGPEGDFTPEELSALLAIATPTSFGPTILRAETAAIFGLSVLVSAMPAE